VPVVKRRTKIVATLGPSTEDPASLRAVVEAGTDVVRLNGAHGTPASHAVAADRARAAAAELGRNLGVLVDLPGPKLRIGGVPGDEIELEAGATFALTSEGEPPSEPGVTTNVPGIGRFVDVGDVVWLADGEILLDVQKVHGDRVVTEVVRGGVLRSRKGLALPDSDGVLDPFTPADREVLDLACRIGAELVGVSFVASDDDVQRVRAALDEASVYPLLVAKVETRRAVDHIEEIVAAADAVMVARGDLGVQIGVARTPLAQKEIIGLCNRAGRPVITATQMLESMTRSPLPTRAEASDVANAVLDGTDALMLSEETGVGSHPAEAVATMARLAVAAESWQPPPPPVAVGDPNGDGPVTAVAHAAVQAARESGAAAIVCRTATGATPRRIASLRPDVPIVAVTEKPVVAGHLALVWGVTAVTASAAGDDPRGIVAAARAAGTVPAGALVAVVAGPPADSPGGAGSVHVAPA
jgi:pyruvate kinase